MNSIVHVLTMIATVVSVASFVANLLPKSTIFDGYPRFQKLYGTIINVVCILAFNFRKYLPSLDVHIPGLGFAPPTSNAEEK